MKIYGVRAVNRLQRITYEFNTIHPLSSNNISKPSKQQLTDKGTDRVGDLYPQILIGSVLLSVMVDVSNHGSSDGDGEDIVGISEEPDSGYETCSGVEPLLVSIISR
jgi:hypothetical protein